MSEPYDWLNAPIHGETTLIEASAGTGKTFTITGLVLRLLLEGRVEDISRILIVTFTIAATQELHDRVRSRIRDALQVFETGKGDPDLLVLRTRHGEHGRTILREALIRFDEVAICTIHGFCLRTLEQCAFESGQPFDFEFLADDGELRLRAASDFWRRAIYGAGRLVTALAVTKGWTPETFLDEFNVWSRFPNTVLLPAARPLQQIVADFDNTLATMRAAWDLEHLCEALSAVKFNKDKSPFSPVSPREYLGRIAALLFDDDFAQIDELFKLDPATLAAGASKYKSNFGARDALLAHPFVAACAGISALPIAVEHSLRAAFFQAVKRNMETAKREDNQVSFDDLLALLHSALQDPRGRALIGATAGQHYQAALIDEFQDTDYLQYDIFKKLFPDGPLYLIGDPKQSIYSFRGADIFAYLAARRDAAQEYTLTHNWRSQSQLVAAINAIFNSANRPFVHQEIPFHDVKAGELADKEAPQGIPGPVLQWWFLPAAISEKGPSLWSKEAAEPVIATAVANEIVTLLGRRPTIAGRPLHPGDFAVLVRTNKQATLVQEYLRRARLPAVIAQSGDIFESAEMEEVARILAAILDPLNARILHAGLATEIWGKDAAEIHLLGEDEDRLQQVLERCGQYAQLWSERGLMPMMRAFMADFQVRRRLLAYPNGERRLTNLLHAVELLNGVAVERQAGPQGLVRWLVAQRAQQRHEPEISELRLESDERAVKIVTIHKSKGLEYNIVFCPFLWDGFMPKADQPIIAHLGGDRVVYDCGSEDQATHYRQACVEALAESTRLAYVAMTRAKHRCYLVWGPIGSRNGAQTSALGYLLHQVEPDQGAGDAPALQTSGWKSWQEELTTFVARHSDCMALHLMEPAPHPLRWRPEGDVADVLSVRRFNRELQPNWFTSSFSSLIRGLDPERPDYGDPSQPEVGDEGTPSGIFAFARGARVGKCLHEILEHLDFSRAGQTGIESVAACLRRYDLLDPGRHPYPLDPVAAVENMLAQVCTSPIPGLGFTFGDVARDQCFNEWSFYMAMRSVRPRQLADLFRRLGPEPLRARYGARLEQLDPRRLAGFLNGYVDLCFCHADRWYVVDWKSNFLGARAADYGPDSLGQTMIEHHYILQYHLYVTALHRYLRSRLADYDYERHMGGVIYVFLRGVDGGGENGWYLDRPSRHLVAGFDEFFGVRS